MCEDKLRNAIFAEQQKLQQWKDTKELLEDISYCHSNFIVDIFLKFSVNKFSLI